MSTLELNVYEIFKAKFGEKEAKEVIEFIDTKVESKVENKTEISEKGIAKDIHNLRQDINKNFATKEDLANVKSDMIKWMFIFWITQMISLFAFMLYFVKK